MHYAKILRVNLTEKRIEEEEIPAKVIEKFIGGKGLAAYYLYREVKPGTDPLGPENKLAIFTGPLTFIYPSFARYVVASKSPLTKTFSDSYAGGAFGIELRKTGYMGIIIEGKADELVYLKITKDEIAIKDGRGLKGKTTYEVARAFKGYSVLTIGPAGENLVKFAGVFNDLLGPTRPGVAARGGLGAVFGSKNLKAIVIKGWMGIKELVPKLDKSSMKRIMKEYLDIIMKEVIPGMGLGGNLPAFKMAAEAKMLPVRNFQSGQYNGWKELSENSWKKNTVDKKTCPTCPVRCGVSVKAFTGPFKGSEVERIEYETVAMNGPNLGINDRNALIVITRRLNELGLDSISAGSVGAFVMEASEKGLLKEFQLKWGDVEGYLKLIEMIAYRRGIGDLLAEGVAEASKRLGIENIAIHVKGLEVPAYDPRAAVGMALAYATADRGGCHLRAWVVTESAETLTPEDLARLTKYLQDRNAALWTLIICDNISAYAADPDRVVKLSVDMLRSIGFEITLDEFLKTGERIYNLTRMFNVREGFDRRSDTLPPRFFERRQDTGWKLERRDFEKLLDEYYRLRGWDSRGIPTTETLDKLGLRELVGSYESEASRHS